MFKINFVCFLVNRLIVLLWLQNQSQLIWGIKDKLRKYCSTNDMKELLIANGQEVPSGESNVRKSHKWRILCCLSQSLWWLTAGFELRWSTEWLTVWPSGLWRPVTSAKVNWCLKGMRITAQETSQPGLSACSKLQHPCAKTGSSRRCVPHVSLHGSLGPWIVTQVAIRFTIQEKRFRDWTKILTI